MRKVWIAAALSGVVAGVPNAAGEATPPPATTALVKNVNLASIKAIFDNANVPATIETSSSGVSFVQGELTGFWILAVPVECPNSDQTDACRGVALLSAAWRSKPGLEKLAAFTREHQRYSMPITTPDGQPMLRYVFSVADGVGASYVENRMVDFYYEQKEFEQALLAQTSTNPGFAVETGKKPAKAVDAAAALATLQEPHPGGKLAP